MADLIINISALPLDISQALLLMAMLPMRRPRLFLAIFFAIALLMMHLRSISPVLPLPVSVFLLVVSFAILPFLFYDDTYRWRLAAVCFGTIGCFVPELVGAGVWPLITDGAPTGSMEAAREYLPQHLMVKAIFLLTILLVGSVLVPTFRRARNAGESQPGGMFVWFMLLQGALVFLVLMVGLHYLPDKPDFQAGELAVSAACVTSDLLLLLAMTAYERREVASLREEAARVRLECQLDRYRAMEADIEASAHLRHDFRNQLQVIATLADDGDYASAIRLVDELRRRIGDDGGGEVA